MSNAIAQATLNTFRTIVGGVLAAERKRLGDVDGSRLIGEWTGSMLAAAFEGSRRDIALALAGMAGAAWVMAGLPLADGLALFRASHEQARGEWQPIVDKAASDAAAEALRKARGG